MTRTINAEGLRLIKDSEGLRLSAYQDSVGVWTIGYGHTATAQRGQTITEAEAEQLLQADLRRFEDGVRELVRVPLTDNQFAALVSFAFNLGLGALAESTLLRKLNAGDYQGAAAEFPRWVHAGGKQLPGLVTRRGRERQLFLKPDSQETERPWLLVCPAEDWRGATEISALHLPVLELVGRRLGLPYRVDQGQRKCYLGKGPGGPNTDKPQELPLAERIRPWLFPQTTSKSCGQASVAYCLSVLTGEKWRDTDVAARYGYSLLLALESECPGYEWRDVGNFTRSLWAEIEKSLKAGLPVIMGLNGPEFSPSGYGHIVVLVGVEGSKVVLADPATGKLRSVTYQLIQDCPPHTDGKFVFLCRRERK